MAFESVREGQLTEDKLKWGYWWVTHKIQVRQGFSLILTLIDLILVAYAAYGFFDWYFGSGVQERATMATLPRQLINYTAFHQARAPQPLVIDSAAVLNAGEKSYDLAAQVTNPNMGYWVEFDYQFVGGNGPVGAVGHDFILPGATKYIHSLDVKADSSPGASDLQVSTVAWHRVDAHVITPDLAHWAGQRLAFKVDEVKFKAPDPNEKLTVSRATFRLINDTGYGYRKMGFFFALEGTSGLVGVNYVTISDLRPGEVRQVEASWFSDLPSVSGVDVTPDVNIFNAQVYIPPGE